MLSGANGVNGDRLREIPHFAILHLQNSRVRTGFRRFNEDIDTLM